jgi:hypothetical protein
MTAPEPLAEQAVTALLVSEGFPQAAGSGSTRTEGFAVSTFHGDVLVTWWPSAVVATATERAMLKAYAKAILAAGWHVRADGSSRHIVVAAISEHQGERS